jgi:hypothetical protein
MPDMLKMHHPTLQEPSKVFIKAVLPRLRKIAKVNPYAVQSYKQKVEKYMTHRYGEDRSLWIFSLPTSDSEYETINVSEPKEKKFKSSPSKTDQEDKKLPKATNGDNILLPAARGRETRIVNASVTFVPMIQMKQLPLVIQGEFLQRLKRFTSSVNQVWQSHHPKSETFAPTTIGFDDQGIKYLT